MIPCFDNHVHLRPSGYCLEAVRLFRRSGGTHLNLVVSPLEIKQDEEYYKKVYEVSIEIAKIIRRETDVKVLVTLGPHPADISLWLSKYSLDRAVEIMIDGIDLAAKYIEEGVATAIGEVGRPHYKVDESVMKASNEILLYAMRTASKLKCPIILHTESPTPETFRELASYAERTSLEKWRIIKHYSPPYVLENENFGIFPSVIASRKSVVEAIRKGTRFFMETDYLDDRERPERVLPITSVPKRNRMLLESKLATKEDLYIIHVENVEKIYGIELNLS